MSDERLHDHWSSGLNFADMFTFCFLDKHFGWAISQVKV